MLVEAIRDGIVLDHIPSDKLFKIVALLHLEELTTPVTIGNNLQSVRHQRKGIIKMADHFFSPKDVDKIALLAPEVHLNVIRDYQVVEKRKVTLLWRYVGSFVVPTRSVSPMQSLCRHSFTSES